MATINRDTKIYGSFSIKAGNLGCEFFNKHFALNDINAIYKSFSISNIEDAVQAARTLNFSGFAVSMPYKTEVIKYVDEVSPEVIEIGAANTIINETNTYSMYRTGIAPDKPKFKAYNTDIYAAIKALIHAMSLKNETYDLFILGNGGYSKAVQYSAKKLNINFEIITRENWDRINGIKNSVVYNCTPVENLNIITEPLVDKSNIFIDCITTTDWGKILSKWQAEKQFEMYTGITTYGERI